MSQDKAPRGFVRGSDKIEKALSDPARSARVAEIQAGMDRADAAHAAGIAMIREAAGQTQTQIAAVLGKQQSAVSRMERNGDMLLSSLTSYIRAAGGESATLVVVVNGERIELDLHQLAH